MTTHLVLNCVPNIYTYGLPIVYKALLDMKKRFF